MGCRAGVPVASPSGPGSPPSLLRDPPGESAPSALPPGFIINARKIQIEPASPSPPPQNPVPQYVHYISAEFILIV